MNLCMTLCMTFSQPTLTIFTYMRGSCLAAPWCVFFSQHLHDFVHEFMYDFVYDFMYDFTATYPYYLHLHAWLLHRSSLVCVL